MMLPSKQELRRLWFKVHKWLGLCLALPVLLIFLSGSVLVWRTSVDDLLHPRRYVAAAAAQPPSFYLAAARRALRPDERIASLTFPQRHGSIVALAVAANGASMRGRERYFLDPVTGRVLDRASEISGPLRIVHILHGSLLLGSKGGKLVGAVAIALLLSAFSGLWLWWPMKGPFLRGLRWARTQSTNANIHHQAGYWLALPLVVLSLTGATISFSHFFNRLTGESTAVQAEITRFLAPPLPQPRLSLPQVLAAAGPPEPRKIESIAWPTVEDSEWTITIRGGQFVTVDDHSGQATDHPTRPGETTARSMRRIHDGTGMPFAWQLIIFFSGLLGATLALTGVIMWLKGQVREVRMRRRRAAD